MEDLILLAYEVACTALPAFVVFLVARQIRTNDMCGAKPHSIALGLTFSVYLLALFHLTGAGTLYDVMLFRLDFNPAQINAAPFAGFTSDVEGHTLNIALFVPLGVFAVAFSRHEGSFLPVITMSLAVSAAIEVSQLLNSRVTDIDDLIMNAAGALIGYALCRALGRKTPSEKRSGFSLMTMMLVSAFAFRFLLYNEMGLAKVLFGF
jgi:glycopeptide antibiotics resistance protein